ncbi:MAG: bifunctional phosphoserine phosphatase/homoserine phosphotransferase ThrH [Rhodospirillales bacterium]|nr:bifunctional phosphoserine phosphatase/homoserine phosphotransferase ThrH [Rhodospirillaceae bacterium]MDP6430083.1 bifunctional phosphoserine phosphatase/homoserine phosphotransferase ThrH [Rhodospirillales bacterium]MDP6643103.1 bifunctional phosphoserine phosphatase/homoserine phosphotransferase ThrH [Rhodospirillales bacterium]
MEVACLDLEGVLVPEVWIGVAEKTGIDALRATTRDVPDYDALMRQRLKILEENDLGIKLIREVIGSMEPLAGAPEFLTWLRTEFQVVILSDTFYEFAEPLMRKLDWPTLLCHRLEIADDGRIADYRLCIKGHKREAVRAIKGLNFSVIAVGDSYNDTAMLAEADHGILFRAPENVIAEFPQFPQATTFDQLKSRFEAASSRF